jgi:hypothetical protein
VLPDGIFVGRIYQDAGAALVLVDLGPPKARSGPRLGDGRDAAPQRYMAQPPCWMKSHHALSESHRSGDLLNRATSPQPVAYRFRSNTIRVRGNEPTGLGPMQPRTSHARLTIASVATAVVATIVALGICELTLRLWDGIPLRPIDIIAYKASFVTREAAAEYDSLLGCGTKPTAAIRPPISPATTACG